MTGIRSIWRRGGCDPALVALWALFICALPSTLSRMEWGFQWNHPTPSVLDEFSYLLAGDTFAHARLTNPTPVMWEHFETFYEFMHPTYMSKYPPGEGLALAVGEVLGDPLYGAWISMALACAAVAWALRAWLSRGWALAMGLMLPTLPVMQGWSQCYWGGAVQMIGGALLIGAVIRAISMPNVALAITAGIAVIILSLSRPFEGVLLCFILAIAMIIVWTRQKRWPVRFIVWAAGISALFAPINLYYNWRLTGSPFTSPYGLHSQQYQRVPQFFWQKIKPASPIRDPHLRWFYSTEELQEVRLQTGSARNFLWGVWLKLRMLSGSFANPIVLWILALASLVTWREKPTRWAWLMLVIFLLLHMCLTPWMREHYVAPAMVLWVAILGIGARVIWRCKLGGVHVGAVLLAAMLVYHLGHSTSWAIEMNRNQARSAGAARQRFIETLEQQPGDDLVLVDYPPDEPGDPPGYWSIGDWVFNDADIDHSPVIFAHFMTDAENAQIMNYYAQRHVWYVRLYRAQASVRRIR